MMHHDEMESRLSTLRQTTERIKRATDGLIEQSDQREREIETLLAIHREPIADDIPAIHKGKLLKQLSAELENLAEQ